MVASSVHSEIVKYSFHGVAIYRVKYNLLLM